MANDSLATRRKRGMPAKPAPTPAPGTKAFGLMAQERRDQIKLRARKGDLRVQTAYKTAKEARNKKNKYLAGD